MDIYIVEAILNGLLLGGVLALLSLGLNLIFGVIDVVWICYAELVMCGMYGVYYLHIDFGLPLILASAIAIAIVAGLGALLHVLVIEPILDTEPINQLLVTGGVLFFLINLATLLFGIDFKNLGISLPLISMELGEDAEGYAIELYLSAARLIAFVVALVGMGGLYLFLEHTYLGTAIRAIHQDREIMTLMGVDRKRIYLITSAIGGGLAGLAATLLVLQYDVHPAIGLTFGPITFMICVLGGLGNMIGGFAAAFVISEIIAVSGYFVEVEWGYVIAFIFFIVMMFVRPQGLFGK